ncbi:replication initiation and membrane attachment family protein [Macrococcoides caseolyticum]|uniref:replication initiation and membrane attachment family protein n=1 Tax=Macrococcoides caseolyticum TaxID=69966 RepID=UPI001F3B92C3|nr:DnaD domain protein [Macrococcus caseolyticus]MCE4956305.1 DnaD domain protein [Macrococcus caseolyticus]
MQHYFTELNGTDQFTVSTNYISTHLTEDVLKTLYTPLIGIECVGVYQFLSQFLNDYNQVSNDYTHYIILSELKMNLSHFEVIRKRLEAIGLLKTYMRIDNENQKFIYKLISPVMPAQFFNDPMLSVFLYQQVGKHRYQTLKSRYFTNNIDYEGYQDISSKYMDVFGTPKSPNPVVFEYNSELIKQSDPYGIPVHQQTFDFDMLETLLAQNLVTSEQLPKNTRDLISQLAALYDIAPTEMRQIILKSLTSDQTISHEDLRKNARDFYKIEHDGELPTLQVQEHSQTKEVPDEKSTLLNWFELLDTTSPIEMLSTFSKSEPTIKQKRMIESIIEREKLPYGVLNILIQYVLFTKDMKLPQSYIEEIASNWKKKNFQTSEEAYHYVKSMQNKREVRQKENYRPKQYTPPSKEMTPKWLTEDQQNNVPKEDASDDLELERRKVQEMLNNLWEEEK